MNNDDERKMSPEMKAELENKAQSKSPTAEKTAQQSYLQVLAKRQSILRNHNNGGRGTAGRTGGQIGGRGIQLARTRTNKVRRRA